VCRAMPKERSVSKVSAHLKENGCLFQEHLILRLSFNIKHWQNFIKKISKIPSGYGNIYLLEICEKTKSLPK